VDVLWGVFVAEGCGVLVAVACGVLVAVFCGVLVAEAWGVLVALGCGEAVPVGAGVGELGAPPAFATRCVAFLVLVFPVLPWLLLLPCVLDSLILLVPWVEWVCAFWPWWVVAMAVVDEITSAASTPRLIGSLRTDISSS
jgi:hypothetical protein